MEYPKKMEGISVIHPELSNGIEGTIEFEELTNNVCSITVKLFNVSDGLHGLHIHQKGNLTDGCKSAGPHYNPHNSNHGGDTVFGHAGDLGNVKSINGIIDTIIIAQKLSISEIIGRTIVLHEDEDDLGKGNNEESLRTGNSGNRIACAIIGIK